MSSEGLWWNCNYYHQHDVTSRGNKLVSGFFTEVKNQTMNPLTPSLLVSEGKESHLHRTKRPNSHEAGSCISQWARPACQFNVDGLKNPNAIVMVTIVGRCPGFPSWTHTVPSTGLLNCRMGSKVGVDCGEDCCPTPQVANCWQARRLADISQCHTPGIRGGAPVVKGKG